MKSNTNNVVIAGTVLTEPTSYETHGEKFYSFEMGVARKSGTIDRIPVNIPRIIIKDIKVGDKFCFDGQIRTYNRRIDGARKLIITFFAQTAWNYEENANQVELRGFICKLPQFRVTPRNREICDVLIAVNRERGCSDYIPCIVWGRTARLVGELPVGTEICIEGRLQSREYDKTTENGTERRTAYEVSINRVSEPDEE